jgi:hypothetical protein
MLKRLCLIAIVIAVVMATTLIFIRTDSQFPYTGSWARHNRNNQVILEFTEDGKLFYRVEGVNTNSALQLSYTMQGTQAIASYKSTKRKLNSSEFRKDTTYTVIGYFTITPLDNGAELKGEQTKFVYVDEKTGIEIVKTFQNVSMIYHRIPPQ